MPNSVHNLDTKIFVNDDGEEIPVILMGLDIRHPETAESFVNDVIEQFKNQRMCSPPTTANMSVTLSGPITAERFREIWTSRYSTDPILNTFMSMMVLADVLHIRSNELLDQASLVPIAE